MSNDMLMVRIYLSEADHGKRRALMQEILTLLHDRHAVQGVTVFRGIAGFGASGEVHADDLLRLNVDLPLVIEFFDEPKGRGSSHRPARRSRSQSAYRLVAGHAIRRADAAIETKLVRCTRLAMPRPHRPIRRASEEHPVPQLALTHGQVIWLLTELGLRGEVSQSTFNHYVKSLRRLGIPFARRKDTSERGPGVTYNFEDLMELTLALLLRVYGTLPDVVTDGLRSFRADLRPIYRQASG